MCADKTRQLVESANAIAIRSGSEGPGLFHTPDGVAYANVHLKGVRSTGQCNTACNLLAGVWKPKVFRGR